MRKIFIGLLVFVVLLVVAAVAVPFLFKDKLRALADSNAVTDNQGIFSQKKK